MAAQGSHPSHKRCFSRATRGIEDDSYCVSNPDNHFHFNGVIVKIVWNKSRKNNRPTSCDPLRHCNITFTEGKTLRSKAAKKRLKCLAKPADGCNDLTSLHLLPDRKSLVSIAGHIRSESAIRLRYQYCGWRFCRHSGLVHISLILVIAWVKCSHSSRDQNPCGTLDGKAKHFTQLHLLFKQ